MIVIPDIVQHNQKLSEAAKVFCGVLIDICAQAGGQTTLSNTELATISNVSFVTVSNNIKSLKDAGLIHSDIDKAAANKRTLRLSDLLLNALKNEPFAAAALLKKTLIADGTIKENFNSLLKKVLIADDTIKESFNSLLKNYLIVQGYHFADFQQVNGTIKENFNSPTVLSSPTPIDILPNENNVNINTTKKNINGSSNIIGIQLENGSSKFESYAPGTHGIIAHITAGGQRITADEIGILLKIRGVKHERLSPFIDEHRGNTYNNMDELRNVVRAWLRLQRSEKEPKTRLSIEQQIINFREELAAFRRKHTNENPGNPYPDAAYKEFFDYWATPHKSGVFILRESKDFFNLGQRMAYSYRSIFLPNLKRSENGATDKPNNGHKSTGNGGSKTIGHVDFSQFITGSTANGVANETCDFTGYAEFTE